MLALLHLYIYIYVHQIATPSIEQNSIIYKPSTHFALSSRDFSFKQQIFIIHVYKALLKIGRKKPWTRKGNIMKTNIYTTKIVYRLICIATYTPKHRMKIHIVERCDIVVCVNLHPCVESQSITNENEKH